MSATAAVSGTVPAHWRYSIVLVGTLRIVAAILLPFAIQMSFALSDPRGRAELAENDKFQAMLVIMGLVCAGLIGEACWAARKIRRRVGEVTAGIEALAAGRIEARVPVDRVDEIGRVAISVNTATEAVGALLTGIADQTHRLHTAAGALTGHASTVGRHTAETAQHAKLLSNSIDEVNSSLHQLLAGADDVRASIDTIAERASTAGQVAAHGVTAAADTRSSVTRLANSSGEISGVVAFINGLAAQTNLLALNATIEAPVPARQARVSPWSPVR